MNTDMFSNLFFYCGKTETSESNFLMKSTRRKAKPANCRCYTRSTPLQERGP